MPLTSRERRALALRVEILPGEADAVRTQVARAEAPGLFSSGVRECLTVFVSGAEHAGRRPNLAGMRSGFPPRHDRAAASTRSCPEAGRPWRWTPTRRGRSFTVEAVNRGALPVAAGIGGVRR
jgi:hypothetical protein